MARPVASPLGRDLSARLARSGDAILPRMRECVRSIPHGLNSCIGSYIPVPQSRTEK
jgi:hypothetical protein